MELLFGGVVTSGFWLGVLQVIDLVLRILALIVVPRNRKPTSGMAWLLAIFLLPVPGFLLFLLIGSPRLPKKRRDLQGRINVILRDARDYLERGSLRPNEPEWFSALVRMNRRLGALPISGDNGVELIDDYDESIARIAETILGAQRYAHVEFYILKSDETTEPLFLALEDACARGVKVRVLLDFVANFTKPLRRQTAERLEAMGADWHYMLPLAPLKGKWQRPDLRNHRKLVIVDGDVAFIGSQNMVARNYNVRKNIKRDLKWMDVMVRLDGPVVASVDAVFHSDFFSETGVLLSDVDREKTSGGTGDLDCQIVPSGPGFEAENNLRLFLGLLYGAKERVVMISPYFVPDESLMQAVASACSRGVEVQLLVSEISDQTMVYHAQRSYYETLLRAGVRIFAYEPPYILHTKSVTIDDEIAVIGSSNLDIRSFGLDLEISMLVRGEEFASQVRRLEDDYKAHSVEITLQEWVKRPFRSQVLDNIFRLTSALQ
ncbi:MAG: cardiolipin synthase [Microbacterium sp.]